jgi:hypothetical protein
MEKMLPGTVHRNGPGAFVMGSTIDAELNDNLRAGGGGRLSITSETLSRSIYDG